MSYKRKRLSVVGSIHFSKKYLLRIALNDIRKIRLNIFWIQDFLNQITEIGVTTSSELN